MKYLFLWVLLGLPTLTTHTLYTMPTADEEASSEGAEEPPAEEKGKAADKAGGEAEMESKKLEGPDITELEKTESIVSTENPEIVRLSNEAEKKCTEMDQNIEAAVRAREQADDSYTHVATQLDVFYQRVNKVVGEVKELSQREKKSTKGDL